MIAIRNKGMVMQALIRCAIMAVALALAAGCASGGDKRSALEEMQYAYSGAVRWNDFEGAWNVVDPEYRAKHPMTALQFERYKQIQVSGYTELGAQVSADNTQAQREIQINVINKHTMSERSLRYTELWRYDPARKTWWLSTGLPDFWAGQ